MCPSSDRDAWKEQAGKLDSRLAEALEALQRAQDETRATRALSARSAPLLSPLETPDGSHASDSATGGGIPSPDPGKRPFWAFWRRSEPSGRKG